MAETRSERGGAFGRWFTDPWGLPALEYDCNQDADPAAEYFTTAGPSRLHWHQIGNSRLNAIASNRGEVQVLRGDRGLEWLNHHDPDRACPGGGIAVILHRGRALNDLYSRDKFAAGQRRVFGCGYFLKVTEFPELSCEHLVFAPAGDHPLIAARITLTNKSGATLRPTVIEFFGVNIHFMSASMLYAAPDRTRFVGDPGLNALLRSIHRARRALGLDSEAVRTRFSRRFVFDAGYDQSLGAVTQRPRFLGVRRPEYDQPAERNYYPPALFLTCLNAEPSVRIMRARELLGSGPFPDFLVPESDGGPKQGVTDPALGLGVELELGPGEVKTLEFAFGFARPDRLKRTMVECRSLREHGGLDPERSMAELGARSVSFSAADPELDRLGRETRWHSIYALTAELYSEYYETRFLPQGGAYEYLQGFTGAPRDLMIFAAALSLWNPETARSLIEHCLRWMRPDGGINYSAVGFGRGSGMVIHEQPSDLQLFLLWGLTEYVFATGDRGFLDREVPFYPRTRGRGSVADRIRLCLRYIFDRIGFGEHGHLRVLQGDWSDGVTFFADDRTAFMRRGESVFNSALALYVLPRAAAVIQDYDPDLAAETGRAVQNLRQACADSFNGRWFDRAWDGRGRPLGRDRVFLEHHPWLILSRLMPKDAARTALDNILAALDAPSRFGQFVLHPPMKTAPGGLEPGWDVNGGVWFATNFQLAWACSLLDPARAWELFLKNTMTRRAELFPDLWYGIWSGPDAYNADYAKRPGETYFHIPTPTVDFPVMNLNLHAGFLLALARLCGVEPGPEGIGINLGVPRCDFRLETPVLKLVLEGGRFELEYRSRHGAELDFLVRLPRDAASCELSPVEFSDNLDEIRLDSGRNILSFKPGVNCRFTGVIER